MLQKLDRMGPTLTIEVSTPISKASSRTLTEHEYGRGRSLVMRNCLHLPIPMPTLYRDCNQQLSLSCYTYSHIANQRNGSVILCIPHSSTLTLEGEDSGDNSEKEMAAARSAVSEILQELGLCEEEAFQIASSSTHYCKMLIDTVRELDEFSLWNSWFNDRQHILEIQEQQQSKSDVCLSFDQKLRCVSKDKGDNGKIPFLESIGFSLPSAIHLSGLLTSQPLPVLISKVKCAKGFFFPSRDEAQLLIIGKHARQMMSHLSIPIDDDLQCTLSFFEKIEARRGGLDMLGFEDTSFGLLIQSFPRLLLSDTQPYMEQMVEFLKNLGIPEQSVGRVLLLYPPIIFLDIVKDIKPSIQAFEKVGISDKQFGTMVYKHPWIVSKSIQKNYRAVFSYLEVQKVPRDSITQAITNFPILLSCSSNMFKPMMEHLNELNLNPQELGKIIASSPQLLLRKPQDFLKVISFLQDFGFDKEGARKILVRCPEIFGANIEKTLQKKTEFLSSVGISRHSIPRIIKQFPEFFVSDINETLASRVNYLLKSGLSRRDVAKMISRFSPILGYSVEKVLRPKLEYLVNTMNKPAKDIVEYPRYFSYSLEKKIRPRYMAIESRNITCSLKEMLAKNDDEFAADYLGTDAMPVFVER